MQLLGDLRKSCNSIALTKNIVKLLLIRNSLLFTLIIFLFIIPKVILN
jgi:hypothetical protein